MVKSVYFSMISLVALSASSLGARGQGPASTESKKGPSMDAHFPFSPKQAWATEESLLVWRAYEDDLDYAVRSDTDQVSEILTKNNQRIKHPQFDWGTGVRLKLTRYLPSNDPWDVDFIGTYYYSQGDSELKISDGAALNVNDEDIISTWERLSQGINKKAKASVQLNFFNFDLIVGRNYCSTRKIDIHPFIGIRSVLLYQDYKATYLGSQDPEAFPLTRGSFKGEQNFWGVGPRIGADLVMHFGRHWSLLGSFGGSFFAGRSHVTEKNRGNALESPHPLNLSVRSEDALLRSNLDASVGLGWEKWVRNRTVRIAPSFVFEVSEWFAVKRWVDFHPVSLFSVGPGIETRRRYSDLGLMGFNVNLQIDF